MRSRYYVENVLALEGVSDMGPAQHLPLIIMTSPDTHLKTHDILARPSPYPLPFLVISHFRFPSPNSAFPLPTPPPLRSLFLPPFLPTPFPFNTSPLSPPLPY